MKRIIHISSKESNIFNVKALCGLLSNFNLSWYDKVHEYKKKYKPTWCKICKKIYNSEQTRKEMILK